MRMTIVLTGGLMLASPAAAQFTDRAPPASAPSTSPYRGDSFAPRPRPSRAWVPTPAVDPAVSRDLRDVDRQIDRGRDAGTLSRREARGFRSQLGVIDDLARRYGSDGMSPAEQNELTLRAGVLRDEVNNRRLKGRKP